MGQATLNGAILDDGGLGCEYRFVYGLAPTALTFSTPWKGGGLRTGDTFSETITGLHANTTYYFQAQARNAVVMNSGAVLSFYTTTPPGPGPPSPGMPGLAEVQTMPATLITENSARLNLLVGNDGGFAGDCRFEWGVTVDYGNVTVWRGYFHTGDTIYEDMRGLAEGMGYHFRACFRNREAEVWGQDAVFNTPIPLGPVTYIDDETLMLLEEVG